MVGIITIIIKFKYVNKRIVAIITIILIIIVVQLIISLGKLK